MVKEIIRGVQGSLFGLGYRLSGSLYIPYLYLYPPSRQGDLSRRCADGILAATSFHQHMMAILIIQLSSYVLFIMVGRPNYWDLLSYLTWYTAVYFVMVAPRFRSGFRSATRDWIQAEHLVFCLRRDGMLRS